MTNKEEIITPAGNSELKPLPALDYRRNILPPNEHSANCANTFRNFGNGSSSRNVRIKKIFQNSI